MSKKSKIDDALKIIQGFGFPRAQQNERSALCLLALLGLSPTQPWTAVSQPMIGITPIMDFIREQYGKHYAPNTRETFRRQSMHQFVDAGIAVRNPDDPKRAVNSPGTVYQIEPGALEVIRSFKQKNWQKVLGEYLETKPSLVERYARVRDQNRVPLLIADGKEISLSPGAHSELIKEILEEFAPRFAQGAEPVYVGDTGEKWAFFDRDSLAGLGVSLNEHGKMPDVVLYEPRRNWLLLIESVTSHGPVDGKRHDELAALFDSSSAGLVYVTAFPSRADMMRFLPHIAWETEVWCADAPSHLIHFNGERFLGPYT